MLGEDGKASMVSTWVLIVTVYRENPLKLHLVEAEF